MVKVSVIVPVYNVENYLEKCLESLVNQTIEDIEIIVVNDGSPDNSQKIIDNYVQKYPNLIKGYVKENGGLSDARNYGIERANGEYIGFVDSDDYVEPTMFEKLYKKALENDFDIAVCDVNLVGNNEKYISSEVISDIYQKNDVKTQMINIYPVAWNKIYKRTLFSEKTMFKKGVWYEDVEFLYRVFPYIKSIGTVKEALINYVDREGAITKTFDERLYNYIDNWNGIVDFYKKNDFYDEFKDELEYCYVRYLLATFIKNSAKFDKKNYKIAVDKAMENVILNFPNYKNNKYLNSNIKGKYLKHFNPLFANLIYLKFHKNN